MIFLYNFWAVFAKMGLLSQKEKDNAIFSPSLQHFFKKANFVAALMFLHAFQKNLLMLKIAFKRFTAIKIWVVFL